MERIIRTILCDYCDKECIVIYPSGNKYCEVHLDQAEEAE
jgi:hypothetical protein